jgi:4-methoxybenzoate monooxygenase (O-demethylating)
MGVETKPVPTLDLDTFSLEFLLDPYPGHEQMREAGPVVWLSTYGIWASARHAEVQAALQDWETFSSASGVGLADFRKETPFRPPSLVLEKDPPEHTRNRRVLQQALSASALAELKVSFAQGAERLVDRALEMGELDAVKDMAEIFPIEVFAEALGLPQEGRENLLPYAMMVFNAFGPRNQILADSAAHAAPVTAWIMEHCKRKNLRPGSLGARVYDSVDAGDITEEEGAMLVRSFLSAGLDTTVTGLANSLYCFAHNPEQWDVLRSEPGLLRNAFEEVLRFEAPVQTFFRTTTKETELGGVTLREGEKIVLYLAAANRDPRRWENPERFDIRRRASGHLAFGAGIHGCVGQMVARLEAEAVLGAMIPRVGAIHATGAPVRRPNNTLRGLASQPIRLTPA